eukprot:GHVR01004377.1.p1 GENE.GHVR01004377.1~~GHVR01004377.1.p1  ORF type:complete len:4168 (-),score=965.61 GHVR01004377.1:131-12634(-)
MFRVFGKFNALFFRPRIRGAIQEYQSSLIQQVKDDILKLHQKFVQTYASTQASKMSQVRDIPPISGAIIWARQLERRLQLYMRRVEDVLGRGWEQHLEGQKLKQDGDAFVRKLNTSTLFENWLKDIKPAKEEFDTASLIFDVVPARFTTIGSHHELLVNYQPQIVALFKEVRNQSFLMNRVPYSVKMTSDEARVNYPFAMCLQEAVRTYVQTSHSLTPELLPLVAKYQKDVQTSILEGMSLRWDSERTESYTRRFAEQVFRFSDKAEELSALTSSIKTHLATLKTIPLLPSQHTTTTQHDTQTNDRRGGGGGGVGGGNRDRSNNRDNVENDNKNAFTADIFIETIEVVQKGVDELNLSFSNMHAYVNDIDEQIEVILSERLEELINLWITAFDLWPDGGEQHTHTHAHTHTNNNDTQYCGSNACTYLIGEGTLHELKMHYNTMYLHPPLEKALQTWIFSFHSIINTITGLPRLQAGRFDILQAASPQKDTESLSDNLNRLTFRNVIKRIDSKLLQKAYDKIETQVKQMSTYVSGWLQYQSLWDIQQSSIALRLGDDIENWQLLLAEIKSARSTFDTSDTQRKFGPIVVDYSQVQARLSNKYDAWHKDTLNAFGTKVSEQAHMFYQAVQGSRFLLEGVSNEGSAKDVTDFVTAVQDVRKKALIWSKQLDHLRTSQRLLERQRFQFPSDWLWFDRLEGEWEAFEQILNRKAALMEREVPALKALILKQDKLLDDRIKKLYSEWSINKPLQGDVRPLQAMETVKLYEGMMIKAKEEYDGIIRAKTALEMEVPSSEVLTPLTEELINLKAVWNELAGVFTMLDTLKETPWTAVVPKKIRSGLDEVVAKLAALPAKMRQYEAFESMQVTLQGYLRVNKLIQAMKTDALKERHWKLIAQKLKLDVSVHELSLGHLWEADITSHEKVINELLSHAQGEMALEEFLRQVKEVWGTYELELVPYQSKTKLIRAWDELFEQIDEHQNSLASMKMSPYFKVFEEEAVSWDDKLSRLRIMFDAWMDVQRRWVYLEGIFFGSADIQQLLPNEHSRFRGIDHDFLSIMKKVNTKPKVMEVAQIEGIQRSLDRLAELLGKIQKALGDYLERQRSHFARFYFVGDEDLLEMIGNSKDVKIVQRHLSKMFAGITALEMNPTDPDIIIGMSSKEGESVLFTDPVVISQDPAINAWLGKVERAMQNSLATFLEQAIEAFQSVTKGGEVQQTPFLQWVQNFPAQIMLLSVQVDWSTRTEAALSSGDPKKGLASVEQTAVNVLNLLAAQVLDDLEKKVRQKYEQLVTEFVHQRDVSRQLILQECKSEKDFKWLQVMRFYWNPREMDVLKKLSIVMANATFTYGFEYLGIGEKLVQTPLTDSCYLTLTQALHMRLGGNPFGPAGTGKTETVKALGSQLGRFVLVFCCDEAFDFHAMGRIFVGLCQVGAWGCFDEFNRLEERILSAVSEQILSIQIGLKNDKTEIEIINKQVKLNPHMGIFVTMNPGYAGRSNLPDNLKQLFREVAMVRPDKELIAQVMLYSQGFTTAELLAGKIVSLFDLCHNQLSSQPHYDFGLRSLKAVLNSAGAVKRATLAVDPDSCNSLIGEQNILLRSLCDTVMPKLVGHDIPLLHSLLTGVFPGCEVTPLDEHALTHEISRLAKLRHMVCTDTFLEKCIQLYHIQKLTHGNMMVGPVGSGKTSAWRLLLDAMTKVDGIKGDSYIVDPKAVSKEQLYGKLDNTTLEWTDGVFTEILRKILLSLRGEKDRRHWIVFDGDVDPEWAENLNSVLDDNKLLTLPNGERLQVPSNVRIMFEVETLKYATLATVSRCGMVWFSDEVVTDDMIFHRELNKLKYGDIDQEDKFEEAEEGVEEVLKCSALMPDSEVRVRLISTQVLTNNFFTPKNGSFISKVIDTAAEFDHIMVFTRIRVIDALFSLIRRGVKNLVEVSESRPDFPLSDDQMERYISKYVLFSCCWAMGGGLPLIQRRLFCRQVGLMSTTSMPKTLDLNSDEESLLDYEVRVEDAEWYHWRQRVPLKEISPQEVDNADLVIVTVDTVRHRSVLGAWMEERKPFVLCGPPGSGKSMTLMSTLKSLSDIEIASLNFSSGSTPELLLKTFDHYCEYVKTPHGVVLRPSQPGKWLVVFCDEVNLPSPDKYGTQKVIMFMRQLTEMKGFWRPSDRQWVKMERVQFVGACNPPTDAGRSPLSDRFLRHAPLLFVDFPAGESLRQIYGTFNRGMLKMAPHLKSHSEALTNSMVEFYLKSQQKFTSDMQPHYIYSPRELTRWKVAILEALRDQTGMSLEALVRLFVHEGLRIFQDRLVEQDEKVWTDNTIDEITLKNFSGITAQTLQRPLIFSCWHSQSYTEVDREELRQLVNGKLRVFNEEELSVHLVIFDQVLDHITRIDRVLRQPLGHLLLVGASGAGKTVLSKFVSWMNGLTVFQIKAGRNYDTLAFEIDLRYVMKQAGVKDERITFIFDESNALGPAFLERMNALLASGEVPGLFEGDEYTTLISECRLAYGADVVDESELFAKFTKQVQRNLHIVFTMNPANPDFANRSATSPALFNRCIIDWFGDWPHSALVQVAEEFTSKIELTPSAFELNIEDDEDRHMRLANVIVATHEAVEECNAKLVKAAKKANFVTPRDFLDNIRHVVDIVAEKKTELIEQQQHLQVGLEKLKETEEQVSQLQASLAVSERELTQKKSESDDKMKLMVTEQTTAEEKKKIAEVLAKELDKKSTEIEKRTVIVKEQLLEAEPALLEAKNSVRSIKKSTLDELKALHNPPSLVKLALEPVVMMLYNPRECSWDDCKKAMKQPDFINQVLNFEIDSLKESQRTRIEREYLNSKEWDTTKIDRASKAAGPLAIWVESQFKFSRILQSIEPLQTEITSLNDEHQVNQSAYDEATSTVTALEVRIQEAKEQYAELIAQVQTIKTEMSGVKTKVLRSQSLLTNLSSEKTRWFETSLGFEGQVASVVADCVLSAAFCTYYGFFDHHFRSRLMAQWRQNISDQGLKYRHDISLIDFLSKPSERLRWLTEGLPDDDLSTENAIILQRFGRYPLVIDPSGQAVNFIVNKYASSRLIKTSFADASFMKNLESALRFGTALLLQDVERVDPILNSVLNRETHRQGGRVLITLGDQDIDFSPSFTMFLSTRDPTATFTPDLCSRVTFVNFTVTPSSLMSQCMSCALKSERPDVDKKRADMLKLQGEFRVRVRELEESLLQALSNVKGNILDDENVITTLETLKQQAAQVAQESARTDQVMEEIERTSDTYTSLSQAASRMFFALEQMGNVCFLYQYSLQFFLDIFTAALNIQTSSTIGNDFNLRLEEIFSRLFSIAHLRVSRGLQQRDRIIFALRLVQIYTDSKQGSDTSPGYIGQSELDILLRGAPKTLKDKETDNVTQNLLKKIGEELQLTSARLSGLQDVITLPVLKGLLPHMEKNIDAWKAFMAAAEAETMLPSDCFTLDTSLTECSGKLGGRLVEALIIKALRRDRLPTSLQSVVEASLGTKFLEEGEKTGKGGVDDIQTVLMFECQPQVPLVLVSAPGFDPSTKVIAIAKECGKGNSLQSIAMGSQEGFALAERSIQTAASGEGSWVLLKNVHLSVRWLQELEKKLHRLSLPSTSQFRVILTMEMNPNVPLNLLRVSNKMVFEPPAGVRASLLRSYGTLMSVQRSDRQPVERSRIHFLLAVLHSLLLERKRYAPVGWTKGYEFSDADQKCSLDMVDYWLDQVSNDGTVSNVDPNKIPWEAIRVSLKYVMYGGRVDNAFDFRVLASFVDQLFNPSVFEADFNLSLAVENQEPSTILKGPDTGRKREHFISWIEKLPGGGNQGAAGATCVESPAWLGLAPNAERLLRANRGDYTLSKWLGMQSGEDDLKFEKKEGGDKKIERKGSQGRRSSIELTNWLVALLPKVQSILSCFPEPLDEIERHENSVHDPLFRFMEREVATLHALHKRVKIDIEALLEVCGSSARTTNAVRALAQSISTDAVPTEWKRVARYAVASTLSCTQWLSDFFARLEQVRALTCNGGKPKQDSPVSWTKLWGGGLLFPEAYLTATRQAVAQRNQWSLEDLFTILSIGSEDKEDDTNTFILTGITLEGAAWDPKALGGKGALALTNVLLTELPEVKFRWAHKTDPEVKSLLQGKDTDAPASISVPVYLNTIRCDLVTSVHMRIPPSISPAVCYQRGVCLTLWSRQ